MICELAYFSDSLLVLNRADKKSPGYYFNKQDNSVRWIGIDGDSEFKNESSLIVASSKKQKPEVSLIDLSPDPIPLIHEFLSKNFPDGLFDQSTKKLLEKYHRHVTAGMYSVDNTIGFYSYMQNHQSKTSGVSKSIAQHFAEYSFSLFPKFKGVEIESVTHPDGDGGYMQIAVIKNGFVVVKRFIS